MVGLGRPYHFKCFTACLPQILLGPFLNTFTHICSNYQMADFLKLVVSNNNLSLTKIGYELSSFILLNLQKLCYQCKVRN